MQFIQAKNNIAFAAISILMFQGAVEAFVFHGFSENGEYLSFENKGHDEETGHEYRQVMMVDVRKNRFLKSPYFYSSEMPDGNWKPLSTKTAFDKMISNEFREMHISSDTIGKRVISRADPEDLYLMAGDPTQDIFVERFLYRWPGQDWPIPFEITLKKTSSPSSDCPDRGLIDLTIKNLETGIIQPLQVDTVVPQSRGCVYDFYLKDVYVYKDRIAVFILAIIPSVETPAVRPMVVTGILNVN